jgi:hypothetical protein
MMNFLAMHECINCSLSQERERAHMRLFVFCKLGHLIIHFHVSRILFLYWLLNGTVGETVHIIGVEFFET